MNPTVSVIIPTIGPRAHLLERAVRSVQAQTYPVEAIIIESDTTKSGAAITRQRALDQVTTDFVLPLDDDDTLKPQAVEHFVQFQKSHGFDMIYGHYDVIGGTDPRPENLGRPFDPQNPVQTTIVVFSRTAAAQDCGYIVAENDDLDSPDRHYAGEDWHFISQALQKGYRIGHMAEKVFDWYHHGSNTSGLPKNW